MKFVYGIFALYVFILTILPCVDQHGESMTSDSFVIHQSDNGHCNDFDACSPFCTCNCCHVMSLISLTYHFPQNFTTSIFISQKLKLPVPEEILLTIWQPPKI